MYLMILSNYECDRKLRPPTRNEVLICSNNTKSEEVRGTDCSVARFDFESTDIKAQCKPKRHENTVHVEPRICKYVPQQRFYSELEGF